MCIRPERQLPSAPLSVKEVRRQMGEKGFIEAQVSINIYDLLEESKEFSIETWASWILLAVDDAYLSDVTVEIVEIINERALRLFVAADATDYLRLLADYPDEGEEDEIPADGPASTNPGLVDLIRAVEELGGVLVGHETPRP